MPLVPGYDYDIFVSYAHADQGADATGKWVNNFVHCLFTALKQRLGGPDDFHPFFDETTVQSNHQLDELCKAASRSAVFLAIASRSYAVREWTRKELAAFIRTEQDVPRLFAAECLPLDDGESYPAPLQTNLRMPFWRKGPHSNTPMALSLSLDRKAFQGHIHDLAEQIKNQLVFLRNAPRPASPGTSPPPVPQCERRAEPQADYCPVLLAQVTDDLDDERDELRRYLEQFKIIVLPADTYPQGGDSFKTAFAADLARAELFVQLLGRQAGRTPPDLGKSYARFQHEAALAHGIRIVQWRRSDLDPESVTNLEHRALLSAETVIATGLQTFKAEVRQLAIRPPPAPVKKKAAESSWVFINADKDDADIAKTLATEFERHNIGTVLPIPEGPAEAVLADLEGNIVDCDALVFVYGQTTPFWVRGQLRLYNKLKAKRAAPPRILAVYSGPPATKPELRVNMPEVREIDCRAAVTFEPMRALIAELES